LGQGDAEDATGSIRLVEHALEDADVRPTGGATAVAKGLSQVQELAILAGKLETCIAGV
jgi:hypothetical protein